jgi:hypothetical protein
MLSGEKGTFTRKPDGYQLSFAEPFVDKGNKMRYYDVL